MKVTLPSFQFYVCIFKGPLISCLKNLVNIKDSEIFPFVGHGYLDFSRKK